METVHIDSVRRFTLGFVLVAILCAAELHEFAVAQPFTGAPLRARMLYADDIVSPTPDAGFPQGGRRSIPLAFGLSAAVPGLGQLYNGHVTKAVIAGALEAAVIVTWLSHRNRGLDAEDDFRAAAHAGWSPARYAAWLNDYRAYLIEEHGAVVSAPSVEIPESIDFTNPGSWSESDRASVGTMIDQIHRVERQMFHAETGATFSHVLPGFGEQQYYELIGKYFQFAPGWNDYPDWVDEQGGYTEAIDPELPGDGGSKLNVSDSFYDYADEHADAQNLLRTASHLSLLLVVNHVLASVESAVSAKLHNDRLSSTLGLAYVPGGGTAPVALVRFRF